MLSGFLGKSIVSMGEDYWRSATREQLIFLSERLAALDRERAIELASMLLFKANAANPVLAPLSANTLGVIVNASVSELEDFAARIVKFDPTSGRELWTALGAELGQYDAEFREWLKGRK